ncbi:alcohol dehydrogenase-like regulatory protein ErcA [uncultured Desulfosarcina sp.]|uniref:alcohol dehydrogenase-like regulatory protein ErcA n=1 Tax=uncultured Desulfosarcina sp. TaxID=218289 RepID=UPI0029C759C3|nr:alcohol dehydrogenase-like regulatory protein ErcA [uncultured Desulfosarcina sp.]
MDSEIFLNLRKFLTPEIVYGEGALQLAGRHALNLGATKVLVVTDPGVQDAGWALKVGACLEDSNIPYITFSDVTPNPKDYEVEAGAALYRKEGCDLIIAVGGGSPMDCAKGIGVVAGNAESICTFEGVDEVPNPGPPLIFIPTTAGTSADVSQFAIITDTARQVKIAIVSKMVIPDIALVDPTTTVTMPPELTAETGMDALCHAFEAYVSTASSPLTDMAALSSVRLVMDNLIKAFRNPEDMVFRDNMMMASLKAGLSFSNASLGLVHAMAHSLGGALDLPHGECNAMLLEKVVLYNYSAAGEKYDQLANAMGLDIHAHEPSRRASILAEGVASLRKQVGITQHLVDLNVSLSDLPRLAGYAHKDPCLATNPRTADPEDIEKIYKAIYE